MKKVQYIKKYPSKVRRMVKEEIDGEIQRVSKLITNPVFKRTFNKKIGVLFAEPCGDTIIIGFSLCHSKEDKFDCVKKVRAIDTGEKIIQIIQNAKTPGLGLNIATERAKKWKDASNYRVYDRPDIDWSAYSGVTIPQTIACHLPEFLADCKAYYKNPGQVLVPWAENFLKAFEQ